MNTDYKIKEFALMPVGWFYGVGSIISQETIDICRELNTYAESFGFETDAFPDTSGGILLSIDGWDELSLELTIYFSDINYSLMKGNRTLEQEEFITIEDAYDLINDLANVEEI